MPEGTNMIEYWKNYISKNGESPEALNTLAAAALLNDDVETAKESFTKAMDKDKSQNIRLLNLARFHMMKVMQNRDAASEELPKAKAFIEQYLSSKPEPIIPLKAYATGMKVNIERFIGNNAEAEKALNEATALDPHFSRAFGLPSLSQFEPPTKPDHQFVSFFSPF
jgi:tetratricopeptide (TPR) repeat protein